MWQQLKYTLEMKLLTITKYLKRNTLLESLIEATEEMQQSYSKKAYP